ncbi:hypothetical protein G6F70_005983 [Rhizopus microsporus]|uniref:Catalase n=1 Tax=Rhizopus azygosporus TaxID=86630 RepID=A0A367JFX7_RHIAZ|nr:hypothetical protein G6F71_005896 [Rhizopus microsporus]RCH88858.1 hypothetical protein CU097_006484 [Rhizopus azygosporus]KAG1198217.1 hypothetical protein G6F70_005983 [Rhizopus microsporus]KAG1209977.1 hypothetical protein G6F69_005886 [Rhizopus microsporus]CEI97922.1 Putative Catalase [Rhizopus microsporus]
MSNPSHIESNAPPVTKVDHTVNSHGTQETTQFGVKVDSRDSLQVGERGPTLLEDFVFREKMTHFDHERIPERVVHARGFGVHGYFQSYKDWSELTCADFLTNPNKKTPTFVRFSTVIGNRGSPETVRDVRGFATRFYTDEGNFDLVGNVIAPFFVQDPSKFVDLIHATKPEPNKEVPQASTAHNTAYDFFSQQPETIHTVLWVLSGRGTPRSFRQVEGFGVNTFRLINAQGKSVFVKFHWKPLAGLNNLEWDEAQKINGKDPDFMRNDMYTAIEKGLFPEYELGVQIIPEEDEHKFDFDILDATKIVPESLIPVTRLGKMVLNRTPDDFFGEVEQVTFHLGHVVRGIGFSDDPLLQGRLFSYLDTQINRMNSVNFHQLPINRPVCPVHNINREGFMNFNVHKGAVTYFPNAMQDNTPAPTTAKEGGYIEYPEKVQGIKQRGKHGKKLDFYIHAQLFYNSLTTNEQQQLVNNTRFELGKCTDLRVRQNFVNLLNHVDHNLAVRVANGIGVKAPEQPANENKKQTSVGLSIENYRRPNNIKAKNVAILLGPGSDICQANDMYKFLTDQGAIVDFIGPVLGEFDGLPIKQTYLTTTSVMYDGIFVPTGEVMTFEKLMEPIPAFPYGEPVNFILDTYRHGKPIALAGKAVALLKAAHVPLYTTEKDENKYGVFIAEDMGKLKANFRKGLIIQRFWTRLPLDPDAEESPTPTNIVIDDQ